VQRAMAAFLEQLPGDIDEAQFLRHREALVSDILKPHENLGERAGFYWQSIAAREWGFDQPQRMADAVAAIDFANWQDFFRQRLLVQPRSLIAASAGKRGELPVYRDADQFADPAALRDAKGDVYEVDLAPL
jgi:insulysin